MAEAALPFGHSQEGCDKMPRGNLPHSQMDASALCLLLPYIGLKG